MIPVGMSNKNPSFYSLLVLQQVIPQISDTGTAVHNKNLVGSRYINLQAGRIPSKLHVFFVRAGCGAPDTPEFHPYLSMCRIISHVWNLYRYIEN